MKAQNILLILFLIIAPALAQQTGASIDITPIPESDSDWEFNLNLDLTSSLSNGILLETPQEVMLIPISLRINQEEMWLQNILSVPDRDSVIAWQNMPQGIMLIAKSDLLNSGDNIQLKCMANIQDSELEQAEIRLKEVVSQTDGLKVSTNVFSSVQIPSIGN